MELPKKISQKLSQIFKRDEDAPNRNNPSHDTPPSTNIPHTSSLPPPPARADLQSIHAFRTTTTLLAHLQQEKKAFEVIKPKEPVSDNLELTLSSAFSTVAVMRHEIVAVVTNRSSDTLELIACPQPPEKIHSPSDSPSNPPSNPPSSVAEPSGWPKVWQFLVSQNPRTDDTASTSPKPRIETAQKLANLPLVDDEAVKEYVEEYCGGSTLARHLWVLSKLLTLKDNIDPEKRTQTSLRLLRYVVTTCHPKMVVRLDRNLSKSYINYLAEVKTFKFNKALRETSQTGTESDRVFLTTIVPKIAPHLSFPISKLAEQADLATHKKDFLFYTEDTCEEFHRLFVGILLGFCSSLRGLQGLRRVTEEERMAFKKKVKVVVLYGYALEKLSQGNALPMHLRTISSSLWDDTAPTTMPEPNGEQEEFDADFKAVYPFITKDGLETALWKSYLEWLRLMVAHFDAVDILIGYVTSEYFRHYHSSISIQIMTAPPPDGALLPWRKLLNNETLFPQIIVPDPPSTNDTDIDNAALIKFLEGGVLSSKQVKDAKSCWNKKKVKPTIEAFERLQSSTLPGWAAYATEYLGKLKEFEGLNSKGQGWASAEALASDITGAITMLCDNARFFECLSDSRVFSGTLHCEACLASILDKTALANLDSIVLEQLEGFGSTIGVSKRCCPVCRKLLSILKGLSGQPFITKGSHNTVTACTLPEWLPEDIVKSMNMFFGAQLRKELVDMRVRTDFLRKRTQSTGSQRLSSDGFPLARVDLEIDDDVFEGAGF